MRPIGVVGLVLALAATLGLSDAWAESVPALVKRGNRLYAEGRLAEALDAYRSAEARAPDLPALHYNIGNVLYRQGEYEKAYEHYREAFSAKQKELAQGARYNAGNSHFARENWQDAIHNYKEALRLNPEDLDAKRNLELALQRIQEQPPPQQQRRQQDQEQQEPQDQPQQQPQEGDQQQDPSDEQPPEPRESSAAELQQLSQEEAMRILDAMRKQDKPPKDQLKVPPPDRRPEKDW